MYHNKLILQNKEYICRLIAKKRYIMLIQFSVRNFRTFREKATLSLIASNYDKETRETENISDSNIYNLRILKSAVVYGVCVWGGGFTC